MTEPSRSSFFSIRSVPSANLRLFCFPYAGGGAAMFYRWAGSLPPGIQVCPAHLPGRENRLREPCFRRIEPLVVEIGNAILPHLDLPFVFFGHSMGALIAFELAHELRRRGAPTPVHLVVSSSRAPQFPNPLPPIHGLPDAELIAAIGERYDRIPPAILDQEEFLAQLLPYVRADLEIVEAYRLAEKELLGCPVTTYWGSADRIIAKSEVDGWRDRTTAAFRQRLFPGGHFFLNECPADLLRALSEDLGHCW